ncbi:Protein PCF-11 a [Aphelenchoides avenae]|nr:Protein PCF-11 a [Aphelenchus avenae]
MQCKPMRMHYSKPGNNAHGPKPLLPFIQKPLPLNVLPTVRIGFEQPPTTSSPADPRSWTGTRLPPTPAPSHSGPHGRQLYVQPPTVTQIATSQPNDVDLRAVSALVQTLKSAGLTLRPDDASKKPTARPRADHPPLFMYRFADPGRLPRPTEDLSAFDMQLLITRYDSVVAELHQPRNACTHCGITIEDPFGEPYKNHLDAHIQETLKRRQRFGRFRPWFKTETEWLKFSETDLVNSPVLVRPLTATSAGDANSNDAPNGKKVCDLCGENLEEYWHDEDDAWKLRNGVLEDGKLFHRQCAGDSPERS